MMPIQLVTKAISNLVLSLKNFNLTIQVGHLHKSTPPIHQFSFQNFSHLISFRISFANEPKKKFTVSVVHIVRIPAAILLQRRSVHSIHPSKAMMTMKKIPNIHLRKKKFVDSNMIVDLSMR